MRATSAQIAPQRRSVCLPSSPRFDSVNSIGSRYTPFLQRVPTAAGASVDAAVTAANRATPLALRPGEKAAIESPGPPGSVVKHPRRRGQGRWHRCRRERRGAGARSRRQRRCAEIRRSTCAVRRGAATGVAWDHHPHDEAAQPSGMLVEELGQTNMADSDSDEALVINS